MLLFESQAEIWSCYAKSSLWPLKLAALREKRQRHFGLRPLKENAGENAGENADENAKLKVFGAKPFTSKMSLKFVIPIGFGRHLLDELYETPWHTPTTFQGIQPTILHCAHLHFGRCPSNAELHIYFLSLRLLKLTIDLHDLILP